MGAQGSRRRFPKHRETVLDILIQSQRIPSFPVLRKMNLAKVDLARSASHSRIGWTCLFGRAYAMVCDELPELRDLYVSYPIRNLYRHPHSVCSVSVQRKDDQGVDRLIWGRWVAAESMTLLDLQNQLDDFRDAPLRQVADLTIGFQPCGSGFFRSLEGLCFREEPSKRKGCGLG